MFDSAALNTEVSLTETLSMEFCFELLGFDILVDSNYKPWLIEVNAPPAISVDIPLDQRVKESLIKDTIKLLKFPNPN